MSAHDLTVDVLLALGVGVELLCCAGVLAARDTLDRIHYAGASTTLGPLLIGAAILLQESVSASGITTIVTIALLLLLNPALTIATARAARPRYRGEVLRLGEEEESR